MTASTSRSDDSTYVYCVTRAAPFQNGRAPFQSPAIGDKTAPIFTAEFMDLAVVVSPSPFKRYDVSRANTMAHQLVSEEVMSRSDILPVRFGTVARSVDDVCTRLLKRRFGELHGLLNYVAGRVELGLKIFWIQERLFSDLVAEHHQIGALRDSLASQPPDASHYERIRLGTLVEEAIIAKRDREAEAILELLRPLAVSVRVNKVITDMMVLNAAFLVERQREHEFDAAVRNLDAAHSGRLMLKYAGPIPPYNFVSLIFQLDD